MGQQLSLNSLALNGTYPTAADEVSEPRTFQQMERDVLAMEEAERRAPVKPWLSRPRGEPPSAMLRAILEARRAADARMKRLEARGPRRGAPATKLYGRELRLGSD